jgi:hypothetical protein
LALDEPRETDDLETVNGFQYIVNKDFYEKAKPIRIDFTHMGFKITSSIELAGCSSCGDNQQTSCCATHQ